MCYEAAAVRRGRRGLTLQFLGRALPHHAGALGTLQAGADDEPRDKITAGTERQQNWLFLRGTETVWYMFFRVHVFVAKAPG